MADTVASRTKAATEAVSSAAKTQLEAGQAAMEAAGEALRRAAEAPATMFSEMTKRFAELRFPSMVPDGSALLAAHRRNMEVLSHANRLALEGAQGWRGGTWRSCSRP